MAATKQLVLVRHAKSDWSGAAQDDFQRPLNERGLAEASLMGQRLLQQSIQPELIISSSAHRALTTAQLIAKQLGLIPPHKSNSKP